MDPHPVCHSIRFAGQSWPNKPGGGIFEMGKLRRPRCCPHASHDGPARLDDLVEDYRQDYGAYYQRCRAEGSPAMRDPNVVIYLVPGVGIIAFVADKAPVLLIDEIDKADIEFPNDLLLELDRMEFFVYELKETIVAKQRPIVMITSNNEKELPDAFLRRCFFHYIRFPDRETMQRIIDVHFPGLQHDLVHEALTIFYDIRDVPGLKKKPSTSELLDWLKLLLFEDMPAELLRSRDPKKLIPPLHGALLKNEQDVHLFERLAFLNRRERG